MGDVDEASVAIVATSSSGHLTVCLGVGRLIGLLVLNISMIDML